eukprot:273636-Chlamydomonas_euryale.AAC.10
MQRPTDGEAAAHAAPAAAALAVSAGAEAATAEPYIGGEHITRTAASSRMVPDPRVERDGGGSSFGGSGGALHGLCGAPLHERLHANAALRQSGMTPHPSHAAACGGGGGSGG